MLYILTKVGRLAYLLVWTLARIGIVVFPVLNIVYCVLRSSGKQIKLTGFPKRPNTSEFIAY